MQHQKGRPTQEVINRKIEEGEGDPSQMICPFCRRPFPTKKSLKVHLRTHTGERPYKCDYPGCNGAFTQSGQLKTHHYIHTGEKLFICQKEGCGVRWKHPNRFCPDHDKKFGVRRDGKEEVIIDETLPEPEKLWLKRYRNKKYNSRGTKRPAENDSDEENIPMNKRTCDDKYRNKKYNSRGTKRPAGNDSNEENVPVNNKKSSDDTGYNSNSTDSPSSSPIYNNDECSKGGLESSSSSSFFCKHEESSIAGARLLQQLKIRSSAPIFFTHTESEKEIALSLLQLRTTEST